jgi:acid phosphatase (class A)
MKLQRAALIAFALLLSACESHFPYPPQFVAPDDVSIRVLGAPPAKYSTEYNGEIDRILALQSQLTPDEIAIVKDEDHIRPEMLVTPVLGPKYTAENYPALFALLKHAGSDAWRISDDMEDYWQSPRPWYADARVKLYVNPITRPGYPSGHTTTNTIWAYILGDLFPAKREALLARATQIGLHRVEAGAHFPHDVKAGSALGALLYERMKTNPGFLREFAAAKAELQSR